MWAARKNGPAPVVSIQRGTARSMLSTTQQIWTIGCGPIDSIPMSAALPSAIASRESGITAQLAL